jgi:hypothetical protein
MASSHVRGKVQIPAHHSRLASVSPLSSIVPIACRAAHDLRVAIFLLFHSKSPQSLCQENSTSEHHFFSGGLPADARLAARIKRTKPKLAVFERWLAYNRTQVSAKSPTGEALKYIAKYWAGLNLFLADGRIEIDNNPVERTIRPIALNRKNALFAGHETGAQNWAMLASLIETCKLNAVEPHAYITGILTAIVNGHKQSDIEALLPWNFKG